MRTSISFLGLDDMTIYEVYKQEVKETLHRVDIHLKMITAHKSTITYEYQKNPQYINIKKKKRRKIKKLRKNLQLSKTGEFLTLFGRYEDESVY